MKLPHFSFHFFLSKDYSKNFWKALIVLIIGLLLTIAATFYTQLEEAAKAKNEYVMVCNDIKSKIASRLESYAQILRDGSAVFASTYSVNRNEWKRYIDRTRIYNKLPGVQSVGYAILVSKNLLQQHIQHIRNEGFPNYVVRPAGDRKIYSSIIYIEPFSDRNLRAFGYDMLTEPVRRKAMEISRDSDIATLSGKVTLVQETGKDVQFGTLMYVAVYKNGAPVNTIEQRRSAIKGWVYSAYRMNDFMQGIVGYWDLNKSDRIHLELYDDSVSAHSLMYSSQKDDILNHNDAPSRNVSLPIDFNGKKWIVQFTQTKEQITTLTSKVLIVFIGGLAISFLLFALSLSLFYTLYKEQKTAGQLTIDLTESEERFKILLNSTAEAIYGIDLNGNCTFSNAACHQILGYANSEELMGKNMHDLIHHSHDDGSSFDVEQCRIYSSFKLGKGSHVEDEVLWRKDGTSFPSEYWSFPIFINGIIRGSVVTFFDITERKNAKDLLEQTRHNYETFFNTIDDFLWVLDEKGNIIYTNKTVNERLDYSKAELKDQSVLMVHPEARREEAGRIVGEMLAGSTENCPVPIVTKSGLEIPVETRVKTGNWDGKAVIFGVSKDVSKIKLSEEKFSKAFHSNSALMAISGLDDGNYIDVNDTFLNTLGYNLDEIIGKTSTELNIFNDSGLRTYLAEKLKQSSSIKEVEAEIITKTGTILVGLFSADIIFIANKMCLLTVMVDITLRKQAEEKIKEARLEADEANFAKSEFLSRMSHELRTPLNSILGFAQLIEMGKLLPGQEKAIGYIRQSGNHLLNLINEVLDISRIESGRISLSMEPVQLKSIIQETIDSVQPLISERKISIELIYSPANNLFVRSDRKRLKQVLLNLLNNAIKYNHINGSVKIKTEVKNETEAGIVPLRISITDTGAGISSADIPKLFKPFERIGAERTETEGTGLGLTVVKKLIDAMSGRIGLESTPGIGSTFWIELPLSESQKDSLDKMIGFSSIDSLQSDNKGTVLYIEDNLSNVELVEEILSRLRSGIHLISDTQGYQAVPLAIEFTPDLILLDLDLPDIHGSEVIKLLQSDVKTKDIPVVIISADAMPNQIQKLLATGAKYYLCKPLDIPVFLNVLDEFVTGKSGDIN